jgi:SOS response regulatory protein OraA/RecX
MRSRRPKRASRSTASESTSPRPTPTPLDVAARLLTRAARTEADLESRLLARGYSSGTAAKTVARCRELGYVGDERFAHERARAMRERGAGSLKIAADLAGRGLPEPLVEAAVESSRDGASEIECARRVLARTGRPSGAKAWRLLASRGFPEDVVEDVVGRELDD